MQVRRRLNFPLPIRERIRRNLLGIENAPASLLAMAEELRGPEPKRRAPRLDSPHKAPLERDIQKAIIEALRLHPRVLKVTRFNSGGSMHRGANGKQYLVMFSSEPVPDLFVLLKGGFAWFEVKRPDFKAPRDAREERQAAFLAAVREAGGIGCFVRSVDEALAAIA
jgi:hypothetical protein